MSKQDNRDNLVAYMQGLDNCRQHLRQFLDSPQEGGSIASISYVEGYLAQAKKHLKTPVGLEITCELCGQEMNANCNNGNCDGKGVGE